MLRDLKTSAGHCRGALFLETDDLRADLARLRRAGIRIIREPRLADCGIAAVFADLYGNLRDLIQRPAEAG